MEKKHQPLKIKVISFLIRLIPAFLAVIFIFYFISPFLIKGHLKLIKNQLRLLHPEYEIVTHDDITIDRINYIQFRIKVNKHPTYPEAQVKKGYIIKITAPSSSQFVAPIIIFSLLLAWPGLSFNQRIKALLISLPLFIVFTTLDYPMLIITKIEILYSGPSLLNTFRLIWKHLIYNGGRQFIALFIFLFAIYFSEYRPETRSSFDKVGRNDLCPCGSGKKYKHCCIK